MIDLLGQIRDCGEKIIPDPQTRWDRGGATMQTRIIEDGREISQPVFDSYVVAIDLIQHKDVDFKTDKTSRVYHYEVVTTNGYLRHVKVILPPAEVLEAAEFTIHMDTPYLTGEAGHNQRIGTRFSQKTNQPVVIVGPEEFPEHTSGLYIAKNLGKVATDASGISLAQSAEDSTAILEQITTIHPELSRDIIVVGESRAAMMAPAKHHAAKDRDLHNRYYDITDPCLPVHVLDSPLHLARLAMFLPAEAIHASPVGVDLALHGELSRERGTIPSRAQYLGAAILAAPAFANGEAGLLPKYLPSSAPVHLANFRSNPIAHHNIWRKLYAHTQFAGVNLKGAHLGLGYDSVVEHVIERINNFIAEKQIAGKFEYMQLSQVHLRDDQRNLGRSEHMPRRNAA